MATNENLYLFHFIFLFFPRGIKSQSHYDYYSFFIYLMMTKFLKMEGIVLNLLFLSFHVFHILSQEIKYFFNLKKLQFFISFKEEMLIKVLNYAVL